MENSKNIKDEKKEITKPFLRLSIKRIAEGVEMNIQSEEFEKFFAGISIKNEYYSNDSSWQGEKAYKFELLQETYASFLKNCEKEEIFLDKWNKPNLYFNGGLNLSFLRTVGISTGKKLIFIGVFSRETLQKFMNEAKEKIGWLYKNYIKVCNFELEISLKERV